MRMWCLGVAIGLAVAQGAAGEPIHVLSTTTIVGDVVGAVAGADVVLSVLLPPGTDPHAVQPSPQDAIAIEAADILFLNGAGLEAPLVAILQSARGRTIELSAGLRLRESVADGPSMADPHVWFDPLNVVEWVRVVTRALSEAVPERAEAFGARAAAYEAELIALDAWIRDRVSHLPAEARRLVSDHESFGYFADRYGFAEIGTVFPSTSTLSEPSAREYAQLEDAIRIWGVQAIFVGTTVSATLAEQLAVDTGIRMVFLYTGSLSAPDGPAATYLEFMRFDVEQIVAALLPTS